MSDAVTVKKRRMPDLTHYQAEDMLLNEESVHQVWRRLQISKPYIQNLRDKLIREGRLSPPKTLEYRGSRKFGT